MACGIWRGVDGVARKVKAEWRGVDGVARKVKAEWRGVDGVARNVFQNSLVLYDNGVTNYTWDGGVTNNGSVLSPTSKFYISESIDISGFTKLGITFTDSSVSTSTYPNANVRLYNYNFSSSVDLFDSAYNRNSGAVITWLFDLDTDESGNDGNIEDHDLTNFRPAFLFMLWKSNWLSSATFKGTISKIWFE